MKILTNGIFSSLTCWVEDNVLKRMKNSFFDFSDLYFSSYRENSSKIGFSFSIKMTITRKIKSKNLNFFLFDFDLEPHL